MGDPELGCFELALARAAGFSVIAMPLLPSRVHPSSAQRTSSTEKLRRRLLSYARLQLKFQALLGERAHFMRHNLSENERILWQRLSGNKLGVAFRRQVPVGGKYIADFIAPSARLIVEVDDRSHELKRTADARRDRNLGRLGYRVLRLTAELVRRNVEEAVSLIKVALSVANPRGSNSTWG
jgi:very-short-patch-repair endonuclease